MIFCYWLPDFVRIRVMQRSHSEFKGRLQTYRFIHFRHSGLNNAYLLAVGLHHQYIQLFETAFNRKGKSTKETIEFFKGLSKEKCDILDRTTTWLKQAHVERSILGG
jgi:hypothetical protein